MEIFCIQSCNFTILITFLRLYLNAIFIAFLFFFFIYCSKTKAWKFDTECQKIVFKLFFANVLRCLLKFKNVQKLGENNECLAGPSVFGAAWSLCEVCSKYLESFFTWPYTRPDRQKIFPLIFWCGRIK